MANDPYANTGYTTEEGLLVRGDRTTFDTKAELELTFDDPRAKAARLERDHWIRANCRA